MPLIEPALEKFASAYPMKCVIRGRTIIYQGEVPRSSYIITKGTVRIYSIDMHGNESNISFISEGHLFPVEIIFEKTTSSLHYYEATTDLEVAVVPTTEIAAELNVNQNFARVILDEIAAQYVGATIHIQALEQTKA